jgi:CRP-like cAMP-binding protein
VPSPAAADAFAAEVIRCGSAVRVPGLLASPPAGALYRVADRHGVAVTALPTTSLAGADVAALLRFRLAQYLDIGFVDRQVACARQMRAEPESIVGPGDVHVVAGVPGSGEILCYLVVEEPPLAPAGCRLRSPGRALFPVEQVHGTGLYNRLPILPDLPVAKVREMGRFVRNQHPAAGRDLVARAVAEVGVATFRLMAGPLRMDVDALIGDLEENVVKRKLDFLHVPSVVIHGTVPYPHGASHLYPRYQLHTVHPFACLVSDIATALPRLNTIEEALGTPGHRGLQALLQLRSQGAPAPSMLRPARSAHTPRLGLAQQQTGMHERSRLLDQGAWLRRLHPFTSLSAAEAALLSARLQRLSIRAGQAITCQGEHADAIYIVEAGEATVDLADSHGGSQRIGSLQPGQYCGHAAILDGAEHPVTVTAATDMTVLRLARADHPACLAPYPEVTGQLAQDALRLLVRVDHHHRHSPARAVVPDAQLGRSDNCTCTGHAHPASLAAAPCAGHA